MCRRMDFNFIISAYSSPFDEILIVFTALILTLLMYRNSQKIGNSEMPPTSIFYYCYLLTRINLKKTFLFLFCI